jgi:hypothetical protein
MENMNVGNVEDLFQSVSIDEIDSVQIAKHSCAQGDNRNSGCFNSTPQSTDGLIG